MSMIAEITNVTVSYRENTALRNISLSMPENSFVSVIGPNGAGKTTLLTVLNGLGTILTGTVKIFDRILDGHSVLSIRKDIGYIPQHVNIDSRSPISVKEAVRIGRFGKIGLCHSWTADDENITQSAMETVGITQFAQKPIGHLSGGELQKVSIARALAQQPRMILLDEPTSNLDPKSQREIIALIERIYREKKYTVVFVTHILNHIPDCCTHVVLMKQGRICFTGGVEQALDEGMLSELYDCTIEVTNIRGRRHFHAGEAHP